MTREDRLRRHAKLRAFVNQERPDAPAIVFEHVSLAFDDNVVLEDVSFSVRPGATLFLLGASGSGNP